MFQPIDPCQLGFVLSDVRMCCHWVLGNAMRAIMCEDISPKAAVNDTFTSQTRDVRNTRDGSAVLANRSVRRQRQHASTTWVKPNPWSAGYVPDTNTYTAGAGTYSFPDRVPY